MPRRMLLAAVAALVFAGLSGARAATPPGTIVMAKQIDDIITLDPGEDYELSGVEIATNVYDRLLRYEAEDVSKLVGGVAESWTISPDGKVFTFKMRPNQTFQDGSKLTAEDAAFSLQRVILMDKTPAFLLTQLGWTKDNVKDLVKATAPDTLQFTIHADLAPSLVLNLMTSIVASVVEKKAALAHEANGDLGNTWLKTHSAASGAYRLVAWKPNESVILEANPHFRLGAPANKRVIVRHVPETAAQLLLLKKGDVDIARDLSPDQLATLAGSTTVKVESFPGSDSWYVGMNVADSRLKNPKVREALKYLVDYDGMVGSFLKGRFFVHETFLPQGFLGALDYNPYKLDVAKAKSLLAEAGYPNGFDIKLDAPNTSPFTEIAQSLQQTLGQGGIKVSIVPAELKAVLGTYRARKHQLLLVSWGPDYFDPHTNADAFARNTDNSDTPATKPLAWRNSWYIPDISKETAEAAKELDTAKRVALYQDLQRKVTDEGPFILMFQTAQPVASRANVTGFKAGLTEDITFYRLTAKH
jgi:peptide/nickel transport system substrate-binding protein